MALCARNNALCPRDHLHGSVGIDAYHENDAQIPIPQHFVVTACYTNKIKFSWGAVNGRHDLFKKFEYEILSEQNNGITRRKVTSDNEVTIEVVPGQEYIFYIRSIETSASLASDLSEALDIKIPKDTGTRNKINPLPCTPRAAKWTHLNRQNKVLISWKSPHYFYGEVSYELLFNDKVLGRCYAPPLLLNQQEIEKFDFTKGSFRLRSIIISKEKTESNAIPIPYPNHIRQRIQEQQALNDDANDEKKEHKEEEKKERQENVIRNSTDDRAMIYIWVCAPDPMPDLKLIPYGDPDFAAYSFKKLDEENGVYLCVWPSYFINELDHYFLFGIGDPKINLAAMPTFDQIHYKGYWKAEKQAQVNFFVVYTHKMMKRFTHAIAGGVAGMHHKYKAILHCIADNIDNGITFESSMKTIMTMHKQWDAQQQAMFGELQDIFFQKLEEYADSVEYNDLNIAQINVILLAMYWLLSCGHHKVHYRHLHHSLNGLLNIVTVNENNYDNYNVVDLIAEIVGEYLIDLLKLFQSFAIEKLKKDRCRYFDLVWYQIIYLSAIKVVDIAVINKMHNEFMLDIDHILFNPNCLAKPIGSEDLQSIIKIYVGLLKPFQNENENDAFYKESGVKLEELLIENHLKCQDILDTVEFINKHKLSYHIFASILYRNANCYTFAEYSDGKQYLPELNIASDQKTLDLLSKSGKFLFVQQQKIPKQARCCLIHLIFANFRHSKDFDERKLFFWFNVLKKLILKFKDFVVADQILYEIQEFGKRHKKRQKETEKKYLKALSNKSNINVLIYRKFADSISICLHYHSGTIPKCLLNDSLLNGQYLHGLLSVLLYFRHSKTENIDNEHKDDFSLHLFGILMLELDELFFAEKYLMKAVLKRPNNSYGHYYTDLALLSIVKKEFISSFDYISTALNKKHTEAYNKLILLYLYHHLIQFEQHTKNMRPTNISSKRFDLNNIVSCDYLQPKLQTLINNYSDNGNKSDNDDRKVINKCLCHYYNALKCLKSQKWQECMTLIDEIYKYINNINIKRVKKKCRQIIEEMKNVNHKIKAQNQALVTTQHKNKRGANRAAYDDDNDNDNDNKYDNDDDDEQKEASPHPEIAVNLPPNNDND